MKHILLVGLGLIVFLSAQAQTEGGAFSATGRGAATPFASIRRILTSKLNTKGRRSRSAC
jgi:hypothetical protein